MARRRRLSRARPLPRPTQLVSQVAMLTRILGAIDEYVYVGEMLSDDGYRLLYQGPCRGQFLGLADGAAARSAVWAEYVHPDDRALFTTLHRDTLQTGSLDGEYRLVGADGVVRWVRDRGRVRRAGTRSFLDGSVLDVTAIHVAQEALEAARSEADRRGREDPLTGVANRRVLPELLDRRLLAGEAGVGVLLLDIDRFKAINDAHGHAVGDDVLVEVASRITDTIRRDDVVARVGGEEFLVVLAGVSDPRVLSELGEAVRSVIGSLACPTPAGGLRVTVSVGGAVSGAGGDDAHGSLLAAADRALYAAKAAGRDRVVLDGDIAPADRPVAESRGASAAWAMALVGSGGDRSAEAHAREVAGLAVAAAIQLRAPAAVVERCSLVGLVHDIGKVVMPGAILNKTGPLTPSESTLLRRHPDLGADLVARVPDLAAAEAGVRHHHERIDGRGYPDGLAGDAIPFEARVVAAVDAFSAMTADRPYRSARSRHDAIVELRASAGTQLDAMVVEALVAVLSTGATTATADGITAAMA